MLAEGVVVRCWRWCRGIGRAAGVVAVESGKQERAAKAWEELQASLEPEVRRAYLIGPGAVVSVVRTLFERCLAVTMTMAEAITEDQVASLERRIRSLEAARKKDSHNSSKPPSSDVVRGLRRPKSLRGKSGKRPGGQPGHPGRTLEMSEVPDVILPHSATHCTSCGRALTENTASEVVDRRQVFDMVPARPLVTEHRLIARKCEACGAYSTGSFPEGVEASVQYGSEVLAFSVYLTAGQFIPLKRASELVGIVSGLPVSQATLLGAERRAAEGLEETEREIFGLIHQSAISHMDETGCFVEQKLNYLHDLSTPFLSHYTVHPKRGRGAFEEIGFLPTYEGVAVHDGCESYTDARYPCDHSLCCAHLLRDATFVEEEEKMEWAGKFKRLLRAMKKAKERAIEQGRTSLDQRALARYERRYTALLEEGDLAEPPPAPAGKRGGPRPRTAGRNLLERLGKQRVMVTRFLHDFRVPFDNSEAERDLRMMKLRQKISGGFRTKDGARHFATIRGYLNTARKQGHSPLDVLRDLFLGHPFQPVIALPE